MSHWGGEEPVWAMWTKSQCFLLMLLSSGPTGLPGGSFSSMNRAVASTASLMFSPRTIARNGGDLLSRRVLLRLLKAFDFGRFLGEISFDILQVFLGTGRVDRRQVDLLHITGECRLDFLGRLDNRTGRVVDVRQAGERPKYGDNEAGGRESRHDALLPRRRFQFCYFFFRPAA